MGQHKSRYYATDTFTEDEVKAIEEAFDITGQESSINTTIFSSKWEMYMVKSILDIWIAFIFPTSKEIVDWNRFAYLHKGQTSHFMEEKANAIVRVLLNVSRNEPTSPVNINLVKTYFRDIIASYLRSLGSFENVDFLKWLRIDATTFTPQLVSVLAYLTMDLGPKDSVTVNARDIEQWLRSRSVVANIINGFLDIAYGLIDISCTHCILPKPFSYFPTILDVSHIIFLCSYLTKNYTKNWKLRFHNQGHGSNYTMLCRTIVGVGPTIIVMKDHGNHVFGCFASDSWKQSTTFYGDNRCFLFQLSPVLRLFEPTGLNNNFMYHNQHQHTLPNGFGMGGQLGFWGLWIDGDFGKGQCSEFCATFSEYHRPSVAPKFNFTHIEVWTVTVDDSDDDDRSGVLGGSRTHVSIVDNDNQLARVIIELAGKSATTQYQ